MLERYILVFSLETKKKKTWNRLVFLHYKKWTSLIYEFFLYIYILTIYSLRYRHFISLSVIIVLNNRYSTARNLTHRDTSYFNKNFGSRFHSHVRSNRIVVTCLLLFALESFLPYRKCWNDRFPERVLCIHVLQSGCDTFLL